MEIPESPNQQIIMKEIIKSQKFRAEIMMTSKPEVRTKKLDIIRKYAKRREQYNIAKKEADHILL